VTYVRELLEMRHRDPWSVAPETSIHQALDMLVDRDVGALLVLEGDRVAGIFSERDYARRVGLEDKLSNETPVKKVMSTDVLYVSPAESIEQCMALMTSKDIRHLPVMDEDRLVGIVSIGDVVRAIIADKDIQIQQLENYVTSLLYGG
jgi:CBS domain-containing protein